VSVTLFDQTGRDKRRKNSVRNHIDRDPGNGASGRFTPVAAQQRVGLLSDRRSRIGSFRRRNSPASRPYLKRAGRDSLDGVLSAQIIRGGVNVRNQPRLDEGRASFAFNPIINGKLEVKNGRIQAASDPILGERNQNVCGASLVPL
jgi:hypothetical protein